MQKRGVLPSCTGGSWSPDRGTGLYGRPLLSVCGHDRRLPRPIREVLAELWSRAPATEGVFRKPGNAKRLSEIKARLEAGEDLDAEAQPVLLLAALLKDFLRQLPDGLLGVPLYPAWMSAMEKEEAQRCSELRQVSDRLPKANVHLLQCLLLVLRHISRSADANKMDARNLAVCISPNLLPVEPLSLEKVEKVTALTQFLIENCGEIFGDGPQTLAADPAEEDRLADSTDSLSSHGQDSAYDSADPEAEADPAADRPPSPAAAQEMAAATPSRRPSCGAPRRPGRPVCRRRSEPAMLRSAGMRTLLSLARGDEADRPARPLAKQVSHDSFLLPGRGPAAAPPPPLPLNSDSSPCSDSSPHPLGSSPCSDSSPCTGSSPLAERSPCDASGDRTLVLSSYALSPKSRPQGYNVPTPGGGVKRRSRSVRREDRRTTPCHRSSQ
ncbi:T-cell activation Rho GTPase-activating protein-like isoform X2 [Anguilla rostrata]